MRKRVYAHLDVIYGDAAGDLVEPVVDAMRYTGEVNEPAPYQNYWDETDCWMITYATSVEKGSEPGLKTLQTFCDRYLADTVNGLHILPFYPYSSDDGFAVIDYLAVNEAAGSWDDIRSIAGRYRLMADLVINHCSSQSAWFQNFISRKNPGKDYFKETTPDEDLSMVVRPRSTPLRTEVETNDGKRWVWCTFGPDQVDLDFANPEVLLRFIEIIRFYLENGVRVLRLDAVAFLWKEPGTTSLHDQRTHEIIKLLRTLIDFYDPAVMLITETNVPNRDNLTYFGNSNEAHAIYNFSLPPLLINTLLTGDCRHLKTWMMSMPPARGGTTYFNFIASHDGIGMRPVDGLLSEGERSRLLETLTGFGGKISLRTGPDGAAHPYEVNISLFDALAGTEDGPDEFQVERFVCAHAIMLALEGIPGIYIHSLLGTTNDYEGLARTGRYRSINRHAWQWDKLVALLDDPDSMQTVILARLRKLIQLRREQQAFHPNAVQFTMQLGLQIFGIWRQSTDRRQDVFSISNVTREPQTVELANINLASTDEWWDLLS
ncbi:MAG: sugar phosphorylase, partial [Gammaproteobacteria bacterium]|nr:sugar phosphorylase [Gammaproteobacteria bacterium]